ncbi:MAG TPA: FlgD immunoglobulin-like domain containing protein, partial [Candidatus Eisenbacteria bacterium]
ITTGGGGRALYPIDPLSSIEAYSRRAFHHVEVTIVGNQLGLAAVTPADSIFDVMIINKTPTTAIALAGFQAIGEAGGIRLRWERTDGGSEGGFYVDRALNAAGPWTRLTPELLRGSSSFEYVDHEAEDGVTYVYRLAMVDGEGRETATGVISATRGAPLRFALERPRPNPTRGAASIPFTLDRAAATRVQIVDVSGRLVRTVASRSLPAGAHSVSWDGKDQGGRPAASGVYFAVVRAGDRELRTRVALLR